eukprot:6646977-Prymnesium_polylepis.1
MQLTAVVCLTAVTWRTAVVWPTAVMQLTAVMCLTAVTWRTAVMCLTAMMQLTAVVWRTTIAMRAAPSVSHICCVAHGWCAPPPTVCPPHLRCVPPPMVWLKAAVWLVVWLTADVTARARGGACVARAGLDPGALGAASLARRLQDPLAELVKVEPKAIGVGMYQHDIDQKQRAPKRPPRRAHCCLIAAPCAPDPAARCLLPPP